jgi:hypothetical protein
LKFELPGDGQEAVSKKVSTGGLTSGDAMLMGISAVRGDSADHAGQVCVGG